MLKAIQYDAGSALSYCFRGLLYWSNSDNIALRLLYGAETSDCLDSIAAPRSERGNLRNRVCREYGLFSPSGWSMFVADALRASRSAECLQPKKGSGAFRFAVENKRGLSGRRKQYGFYLAFVVAAAE